MRTDRYGLRTVLIAGLALTGLVAPVAAGAGAAAAAAPRTVRFSDSPLGEPDNLSGTSAGPAISARGGVVAFDSIATNLVPADTNGSNDVSSGTGPTASCAA